MSEENKAAEPQEERWERDIIAKLAMAAVTEQRRTRRWNIFFKLLFFGYLVLLLVMALSGGDEVDPHLKKDHTAVVEINGMISDGTKANAETIIEGLREAFEHERTKGIVLRINSPGGSPVQSSYVYDEIRRLREKHPDIKVYAVIVDIGASGAYYIAAAADEIYANRSSIVGSIGVLMNGFGFVEAMDKLGIERRLMTAGESKGIMDPFSPVSEEDAAHIQGVLAAIHEQFISAVKEGRGERLDLETPGLFSGLFWTGAQAETIGLIDGFGGVDYVARELIGESNLVDFTPQPDLFERLAERFGTTMASQMSEQMGLGAGQLR